MERSIGLTCTHIAIAIAIASGSHWISYSIVLLRRG
jgi:hypothetical protein